MSVAIGRLRTLGIAAQSTFNTAAVSPTFTLPLQDAPTVEPVQNKVRNISALGSIYESNALVNANRYANIPINVKVDEEQFPLFFKQRFNITATVVTGETTVYEHTLSYTNNTNTWYTLFLEDDNRRSWIMKNALLSDFAITMDAEFVRLEMQARGNYPETTTTANTITQPKDFVGRNVEFRYANYTSTKVTYNLLSANLTLGFSVNDEADAFFLGEDDLGTNVLVQDTDFMCEVVGLEIDKANFDDFSNNTKKHWDFQMIDTGRTITGSVGTIYPYIKLDYPVGFMETYAEDAPLDQLVKETLGLYAVDEVGVANAPLVITVRNARASY